MKIGRIAVLFVLAACTRPGPGVTDVRVGDLVLSLAVSPNAEREESHDRVALHEPGGIVVAVQRAALQEGASLEERTPRVVAAALAERFALGEQHGELVHQTCAVAGQSAECVSGWIERDGVRYTRDGFILSAHGAVVWIDVAGPEEDAQRIRERASSIREAFGASTAAVHPS